MGNTDNLADDTAEDLEMTEPTPPSSIPNDITNRLQSQNTESLEAIIEYAQELQTYQQTQAEKELQAQAESGHRLDEAPEEWDDDEWEEQVEEKIHTDSDVPSGGYVCEKQIDGRVYLYYQWRDGDTVKGKYLAPKNGYVSNR